MIHTIEQQVALLERIKTALLPQGERSVVELPDASGCSTATCAYRGKNGRKCAIGHLIVDQAYDASIEGGTIGSLGVEVALAKSGIDISEDHGTAQMLANAQQVHDWYAGSDGDWSAYITKRFAKLVECARRGAFQKKV